MRQLTRESMLVIALSLLLAPAQRADAWVDTGHKLVAMIAWDELTPAAQAKVTAILKKHPRYEKDLLAGLPNEADDATKARYAFAVAATWPDLVKGQAHPLHFAANHPEWHYIDLPYRPEANPQGDPTQPPVEDSGKPGPHNVVEALTKNVEDLRNAQASDADRAIALCWVLHLGGDIHQPLHTITMFSAQFPKGDKGGNAVLVLREPPYFNTQMNLHLIWDELPGNYKSNDPIGYLADGLRHDPSLSRERLKDLLAVRDFMAWARESYAVAVEHAYLKGTLQCAAAQRGSRPDPGVQVPGLPPGYLEQAERVAFHQVALAGYRTADLLNAALDANATGHR